MNQKYEIIEKIGKGKFGNVFKGKCIKNGELIAIKVGDKMDKLDKLLKSETTILNYLYSHGCRNIPEIYWFGKLPSIDSLCFVMPLYSCSLLQFFSSIAPSEEKKHLDIITSIMVQAISILESIHNNFVIHRDIKPQNFMIKNGELFLIDFGFATFYVNSERQHISIDCSLQHIIGSPKYISLYNHCGILSSRRDDLISLGYVLFYLIYPREPLYITDETTNNILQTDISHPLNQQLKKEKAIENIEKICSEKYHCIYTFLKECYKIEYHDCPDYTMLKNIFINILKRI